MDDHEQMNHAQRQDRIRELNDRLRTKGEGGRIVMTRSVSELPPEVLSRAMATIYKFDDFTANNDPWGEHDFGKVNIEGEAIMWKIDYYDINLEWGSPEPADETVTCRVMTIMLAADL